MSIYFLFTFLLSAIIAVLLYFILLRRLEINWRNRNNHAISFFMPVLITVLLCAHLFFDFRARSLDFIEAVQNNRQTVIVPAVQFDVSNGKIYTELGNLSYFDPQFIPDEDKFYRVSYAKRSSIVFKIEALEERGE